MTSPSEWVELTAEWALWGKNANDTDYRLLRSSTGGLFDRRFAAEIERSSPGTLRISELPQVTVNWLRRPDSSKLNPPSHLGLAIHETALSDESLGGPVRSRFDAAGREIVYVRYYCVPYEQLAAYAVGYQQFYDTFQPLPLPETGSEPITVGLAAPAEPPPTQDNDRFARYVAARLLSAHPVCVLGAQEVPFEDRLRFLDVVMSWLPYGARSQLAVATAVNSTFTGHRYRLFFASAPRSEARAIKDSPRDRRNPNNTAGRKPDIAVEWGQLDPVRLDQPGHDAALLVGSQELERRRRQGVLADYTEQLSLTDEQSMLNLLKQISRHEPGGGILQPRNPPPDHRRPELEPTRIDASEDHHQYIRRLEENGAWPQPGQPLERRKALAVVHGLLDGDPSIAMWLEQYYDLLLGLVLGDSPTYAHYLWVIDTATEPERNPSLLRALRSRLPEGSIPWLLVGLDLGQEITKDPSLSMTLAEKLVADASRDGAPLLRPADGRRLLRPVVESLPPPPLSPADRDQIKRLGFLAPALERYFADQKQEQKRLAKKILHAVYPPLISRRAIKEIFHGSGHPPSPVLLDALSEMVPSQEKYARAQFRRAASASGGLGPAPGQTSPEQREKEHAHALFLKQRRGVLIALGVFLLIVAAVLVYRFYPGPAARQPSNPGSPTTKTSSVPPPAPSPFPAHPPRHPIGTRP